MNWRENVLESLRSSLSSDAVETTNLVDKEKALYKATFKWLAATEFLCNSWLKKSVNNQEFKLCFAMAIAELEDLHAENTHATVNETVELLKRSKRTKHLTSTLNALLRKYIAERPQNLPKIPKWIFTKISKQYSNADEIAAHLFDQPLIDLRLREEISVEGEKRPNGALRIPAQNITKVVGFKKGHFYVQDEAAQLPGFVLEQIIKENSVKSIIDVCCAPGGKLFHFMDVAPNASIIGVDLSPRRLDRVDENAERLKLNVKLVESDMRDVEGLYDFVSLDAPCSATGTSRRHPETLFRQDALGVKNLTELQYEGLTKLVENVTDGGFLLYSTCSLFKDESEKQIEKFLKEQADFKLVDLNKYPALSPYTDEIGQLRTTPAMGCDGFFVALLQKSVS